MLVEGIAGLVVQRVDLETRGACPLLLNLRMSSPMPGRLEAVAELADVLILINITCKRDIPWSSTFIACDSEYERREGYKDR
jgi:hypothetical protein